MRSFVIALLVAASLGGDALRDGALEYRRDNCESAYKTFYPLATKENNKEAQYNIAIMYLKGCGVKRSQKDALYWYQMAASHNHAPSQYALGLFYQNQAKRNEKLILEAKKWYSKAMQNNLREAYTNMGYIYYTGYGKTVPKNLKMALYLFTKGAALGDANAQFDLGVIYGWSDEVLKNKLKSYTYLKEALQNGKGEAGEYLDRLCKESSWICK